jgi:hypothetical protein
MGLLGNDDVRWSMHDNRDHLPPGDVCACHFIEKKE